VPTGRPQAASSTEKNFFSDGLGLPAYAEGTTFILERERFFDGDRENRKAGRLIAWGVGKAAGPSSVIRFPSQETPPFGFEIPISSTRPDDCNPKGRWRVGLSGNFSYDWCVRIEGKRGEILVGRLREIPFE